MHSPRISPFLSDAAFIVEVGRRLSGYDQIIEYHAKKMESYQAKKADVVAQHEERFHKGVPSDGSQIKSESKNE